MCFGVAPEVDAAIGVLGLLFGVIVEFAAFVGVAAALPGAAETLVPADEKNPLLREGRAASGDLSTLPRGC